MYIRVGFMCLIANKQPICVQSLLFQLYAKRQSDEEIEVKVTMLSILLIRYCTGLVATLFHEHFEVMYLCTFPQPTEIAVCGK